MASFRPVTALKGTLVESSGLGWFRKGLVVSQFCISTALIIGPLSVGQQLPTTAALSLNTRKGR